MRKVLLFKGRSQYDALCVFVDDLELQFTARGFAPIVYDLSSPGAPATLDAFVAAEGPFIFSFGFNVMGEYRDGAGRGIAEIVGAPHIVQYVDHPLHHQDRLNKTAPSTALLVLDESHVGAIEAAYGAGHFAYVGFSPTAALGQVREVQPSSQAFLAARSIPLLFTGTYYKPDAPPWGHLPKNTHPVFETAVDLVLGQEWLPAQDALVQAMRLHGLAPYDKAFQSFLKTSVFIHEWVRMHRRYQFFRAAAKVGLPLTVYGSGYDKDLYRYKKIMDYRGAVDFSTTLELMQQSRMVLNINVNFGAGAHDRPFTAMMAGAAVASDTSTYYVQSFDPSRDIFLFRWMHLEDDLAALRDKLDDIEGLHAMALAGQAKAIAGHRWGHRIDAILEAGEAALAKALPV